MTRNRPSRRRGPQTSATAIAIRGLLACLLGFLACGCGPAPLEGPDDELPEPQTDLDAFRLPPAQPRRVASAEAPPALPAAWRPDGWRPWRYIVIHHSATETGSREAFDRLHREVNGWDELGYHFVITNGRGGPDGRVQVGSRWPPQKWGAHTGGTPENAYNDFGIGICLVGNFNDSMPSDAQLAALGRLVRALMRRYQIPPERVIGHRDAPDAATDCPGHRLWAYLNETLRPQLENEAAISE
jgi:hypothetical protein